jgi:hypothetical protein
MRIQPRPQERDHRRGGAPNPHHRPISRVAVSNRSRRLRRPALHLPTNARALRGRRGRGRIRVASLWLHAGVLFRDGAIGIARRHGFCRRRDADQPDHAFHDTAPPEPSGICGSPAATPQASQERGGPGPKRIEPLRVDASAAEVINGDQNIVDRGVFDSMGANAGQIIDVAISGDSAVATNGETGEGKENTVVAISGYKSRSRINAENKAGSEQPENNLRIFPTALGGALFGIAKSGPVWRKPRRQTKPGNPKIAADGYEWRKTPSGNGWVLWRRPYLPNGKRGKSSYVATYAPDSVKQLEKLYGKREISKSKRAAGPRGVDSRRGADSDAGQQNANFG